MKKLWISIMFAIIATIYARGQSITPSVLGSAGTSSLSGNYILDWTLGELSTQTYTYFSGSQRFILTEGFHQTNYEFVKQDDNEELAIGESLTIVKRVYPNPVSDLLNVELSGIDDTEILIELSSLKGTLLLKEEFSSENNQLKAQINMESLPAGMYFLKIYNKNSIIETTKITKLK